jgi:competence protein ComEA
MFEQSKRASGARHCVIGATLVVVTTGWTAALSAAESAPAAQPPMGKKKPEATQPVKLVDINSASRAELKTLPGIGDAEAAKIIAARPYLSKADLATNNVLPTGVYIALKDRIIAKPMGKPVAKK